MLRRILALAALTACAGCQDYLVRREGISHQAGDAVAANKAVHVIDPWPAGAADTEIPANGRRVVMAIERYERGPPPDSPQASALLPVPLMPAPFQPPPQASP